MYDLIRHFRLAFRTLRRSWSVTVLAVLSLTLAIAGNTVVFSLVNGLLYKPLPYEDPHRLSLLTERATDLPKGLIAPVSLVNFLDWKERQTSYESLGAFQQTRLAFGHGEHAEPISGAAVSASFFRALRAQPLQGRLFADEENLPGQGRVAVVAETFLQERMNESGSVLGRNVELNGKPHEIVGVLPGDFEFLFPGVEVYVPLLEDARNVKRHQRTVLVVGRLHDTASDESAQADMSAIMEDLKKAYPEANRGMVIDVLNMREDLPDSRNRLFLQLVQGALLFVLLIACANVANLLLSRAQKREREMAIRSSVGASRRNIAGQLFSESLIMAGIAGLLGLGLAVIGIDLTAKTLGPLIPSFYMPTLDGRVLAFNGLVSLLGAMLFTLAPTLQTFKADLLGSLKDGTQSSSAGGRKRWISKALVVAELAMALIFLAGANVMLHSFEAMQADDSGLPTEELLTVQVSFPEDGERTDAELLARMEALDSELATLPGVRSVVMSNVRPRDAFAPRDMIVVEGDETADSESPRRVQWMSVSRNFFSTLGVEVSAGRDLSSADRLGGAPVILVNQAAAKHFFGDDDPIGRRISLRGETREVVGLVPDIRHGLAVGELFSPMAYIPLAQSPSTSVSVALQVQGADPAGLSEPLRQRLKDFDFRLGLSPIQTLDDYIAQFFAGQKVFSVILQAFGSLALLLAALGTYGVLAYAVVQRTREIGIRMAIGADRSQVVGMILRQALTLAAVGIVLGIPGVLAVRRGLIEVMAGIVPVATTPMLTSGAVLLAVTLIAGLIPALRASGVDPSSALRGD